MPQDFSPPSGMGEAVYRAKYAWPQADGSTQPFAERIEEVWRANYALTGTTPDPAVLTLAREGVLPTSGRHMQHMMPGREIRGEKVTNCSTSLFSFQKFWLLMQGSGVGRSYESALCRTDWDFMPQCRFVLDESHPDYAEWVESRRDAQRLYESESETTRWFEVEDSAEGWVKVVEVLETAAFQRSHKDKLFVFDFTPVRGKGVPIGGQQGRPACGPLPLIKALMAVQRLRGAGMKPWKQAMHVDHYLSQCVQLGGVRRAARIACKPWTDCEQEVLDFINIKRGGFLWTANNSVLCDAEFWKQAQHPGPSKARRIFDALISAAYWDQTGEPGILNTDQFTINDKDIESITPASIFYGFDVHPRTMDMAQKVLDVAKRSRFRYITNPCVTADTWVETADGAQRVRDLIGKRFVAVLPEGEFESTALGFFSKGDVPIWEVETHRGRYLRCSANHRILTNNGLVEVQHLQKGDKLFTRGFYPGAELDDAILSAQDTGAVETVYSCQIPGPNKYSANGFVNANCGEIVLAVWGGYCVIADICLANLKHLGDLRKAAQATTEFLLRANTLPFVYQGEVHRTNRIGVGLTGIFEFAYQHYGYTFFDLIDEAKSKAFWTDVALMRQTVEDIAHKAGCHTALTIKPSGTISKVMGCTEGAHLPAYGYYLRWVVYAPDAPELADLKAKGYPTKHLPSLGQTVVGFPTALRIAEMMGEDLVTAEMVTPEQQFRWLRLIEKHWLGDKLGNQVSYTLKYDPQEVSFEQFKRVVLEQQPTVRACSVMPQVDLSAYAYQPEEKISRETYLELMSRISETVAVETYDDSQLLCEGGACPIEFDR